MDILRTMVRVTMMRGAQSGGTVTYVPSNGGKRGSTGIRSRVVNGKRTNLSHLVANKVILLSLVFCHLFWRGRQKNGGGRLHL